MQQVLLDTDIFSEILAGIDPTIVARARQYERAYGRFTASAVTLFEVYKGLSYNPKPKHSAAFGLLKKRLFVLPIQDAEAELGGAIHAQLKRQGTPIGEIDPLIAATALANELVLATGNVAHYQHLVDLGYPLIIENWRMPQEAALERHQSIACWHFGGLPIRIPEMSKPPQFGGELSAALEVFWT